MRNLLEVLLLALGCLAAAPLAAAKPQIAVVVDARSAIKALTKAEVRDFFLGDTQFLASGERVYPVDQPRTTRIAQEFYAAIAAMSAKELAVYRAKQVFAGRGVAPPQVEGGDAKIKEWIKERGDAIGYIYAGAEDSGVRTLLLLDP